VEPADGPEHTPFVEGRMSGVHSTLNSYTVYFIQGIDGGPIKIGHTVGSAEKRLGGIQSGSPIKLCLLGSIFRVGPQYESDLHSKFQHLRLHGEWFEPASDLLSFIAEHVTAPDRPRVKSRAPKINIDCSRMESDQPRMESDPIELLQARAVIDLHKADWSRSEVLSLFRFTERTYWRRLRLARMQFGIKAD
jgi:hypothetical protein